MKMYYIGVNGSFHDSSVCLLQAGKREPIALLSEDRHSGIPHHIGFPFKSMSIIRNMVPEESTCHIGYSLNGNLFRFPHGRYFCDILGSDDEKWLRAELEKVFAKVDFYSPSLDWMHSDILKILACVHVAPCNERHLKKRINYIFLKYVNELTTIRNIKCFYPSAKITAVTHHEAHAATYYASNYAEAAVITWDGRGEFDSTVLWHGVGDDLLRISSVLHPRSLGAFYQLFSEYCGFDKQSGPGKLMGLAAYGDDRYLSKFDELISVSKDKFDFDFNEDGIIISQNEPMQVAPSLAEILGPPRSRGESIDSRHQAIAHATQVTLEKTCIELAKRAKEILGANSFVFSGGLSLNCVMNEKLRKEFKNIFLLPGCGDDGTALGVALSLMHREKAFKSNDAGPSATQYRLDYRIDLGTKNDPLEFRGLLQELRVKSHEASPGKVASLLASDKVIGYVRGRYEFGPRALGHRSILADPRPRRNWPRINHEIKFREDFRPFAPAILREDVGKFLENGDSLKESPFMLLAPKLSCPNGVELGAVTHVDGTARIQTVDKKSPLYPIISEFKKITGVGVLLNTSLNMSGESIIADGEDLLFFMACSGLDAIVVEDSLVLKTENIDIMESLRDSCHDKNGYLNRRRAGYNKFLNDSGYVQNYLSFREFYSTLFREAVQVG